MKGDKLQTTVLSARILGTADPALLEELKVPEGHRSLGFISTDCDDVSYAAVDEATKKAEVKVVYARSMYAGSSNASTALAGEFIAILSGPGPADVKSGLDAAISYIQNDAHFVSARDDDKVVYFAHCISRTGSYLSGMADIPEGSPLAYLIAPPLEALLGLDAALKMADVRLVSFYGPPTETNFAGGLLTGDQAECLAACHAFADTVCKIAADPVKL